MERIINWIECNKYIIKNKKYKYEGAVIQRQQNYYLFEYLRSELKWNKDQIQELWIKLQSKQEVVKEENSYYNTFEELWKISLGKKYKLSSYKDSCSKIVIYRSEIKYINSLDCKIWIKKMLILLLAYWKMNSYKRCEAKRSYFFELIDATRNFKKNTEELSSELIAFNNQFHFWEDTIKFYRNGPKRYFTKVWNCEEGKVVFESNNFSEIAKLFKSIRVYKRCQKCRKIYSLKTEQDYNQLCKLCCKNQIYQKKIENNKMHYYKFSE